MITEPINEYFANKNIDVSYNTLGGTERLVKLYVQEVIDLIEDTDIVQSNYIKQTCYAQYYDFEPRTKYTGFEKFKEIDQKFRNKASTNAVGLIGKTVEYFENVEMEEGSYIKELKKSFKKFKSPLLYFSGGLDSEFVARTMMEANIKFTPVIFNFINNDGTVLNLFDSSYAYKFCKKHNLFPLIEDIKIEELWDSEEFNQLSIDTGITSSQILTHVYMVEMMNKRYSDVTHVFGGEVRFSVDAVTDIRNNNFALMNKVGSGSLLYNGDTYTNSKTTSPLGTMTISLRYNYIANSPNTTLGWEIVGSDAVTGGVLSGNWYTGPATPSGIGGTEPRFAYSLNGGINWTNIPNVTGSTTICSLSMTSGTTNTQTFNIQVRANSTPGTIITSTVTFVNSFISVAEIWKYQGMDSEATAVNSTNNIIGLNTTGFGTYPNFYYKGVITNYPSNGPEAVWAKQIAVSPEGAGSFNLLDTAIDSGNNIWIVGDANNGSTTYYLLMKITSAGNISLIKANTTAQLRCIHIDASDNIYVGGLSGDGGYIAKFNSSATLQWQRNLPNSSNTSFYINDITVDSSGNIYTIGTHIGEIYVTFDGRRVVTTKFNSSGTTVWQRVLTTGPMGIDRGGTIGLNKNYLTPSKLVLDTSNNIYIVLNGSDSAGGETTGLVKYNNSGVIQWQTALASAAIPFGTIVTPDLEIDGSNNLYIGGGYNASSDSTPIIRGILAKFNSSGSLIWQNKVTSSTYTLSAAIANQNNVTINLNGSQITYQFAATDSVYNQIIWKNLSTAGTDLGTYGPFVYSAVGSEVVVAICDLGESSYGSIGNSAGSATYTTQSPSIYAYTSITLTDSVIL